MVVDPTVAWTGHDDPTPYRKTYVDGVPVSIVAERVEYLDGDGKLVTESLRDFTKKTLRKRFASLDAFLLAVERRGAQAGDHRRARGRGAAARRRWRRTSARTSIRST